MQAGKLELSVILTTKTLSSMSVSDITKYKCLFVDLSKSQNAVPLIISSGNRGYYIKPFSLKFLSRSAYSFSREIMSFISFLLLFNALSIFILSNG